MTGVARLAIRLDGGPFWLTNSILVAWEFLLGFARPIYRVKQVSDRQSAVNPTMQRRVNASFAFLL